MSIKSDSEPNNNVSIEEEVRVLRDWGVVKSKSFLSMYILFQTFEVFTGALTNLHEVFVVRLK